VDVTQSSTEVLRLRRAMASGELKRARTDAARVTLLLDDGAPYSQEGTLQFSDVTVDASTGAITLRALFPNPENVLLPNMFVQAVIEEGVRENAILLPQQAVTRDAKGQAIAMVVGSDNKVEQRQLKTVRTIGSDWLLDSGLQAGDRVIIEGLQRAMPGTVVQAMPAGAPNAGASSATANSKAAAPPAATR
jgi:membrane fusion protein, multidrug efflux system